jgi:Glycine zipper 2TM domain
MITRILAVLALTLLSVSAFAQSGNCQLHHGGGQSGWGNCGSYSQNQQFVVGGQQSVGGSQVIYTNQPYTVAQSTAYPNQAMLGGVGGGLTDCQVYGALAGGTLGSLAKNHTGQAAILGALAGGLVGNTICRNSSGQQVVVPQVQLQQGAIIPQGSNGFMCAVEGVKEAFPVKDSSTCTQIASRMAKAIVTDRQSTAPQVTPTVDPSKPWGHRGTSGVCYFTQELKGDKPVGCSQAIVVVTNSGENMSSWKARLP